MLAVGVVCFAFAISMSAQVKTATETTSGQASHEMTVERGEVVFVQGNDLVVKMEDGSMRHVANVPESAKVTVDGQQLGIHDRKPGRAAAHAHNDNNPSDHHHGKVGDRKGGTFPRRVP
jgi:hypothetical protein